MEKLETKVSTCHLLMTQLLFLLSLPDGLTQEVLDMCVFLSFKTKQEKAVEKKYADLNLVNTKNNPSEKDWNHICYVQSLFLV